MQRGRQPEDQQQKGGEAAGELHAAKERDDGGVVNPAWEGSPSLEKLAPM